MIPNNLDEAVQAVFEQLTASDENIENLLNLSEEDFTINAHHSYGQFIRNNWAINS